MGCMMMSGQTVAIWMIVCPQERPRRVLVMRNVRQVVITDATRLCSHMELKSQDLYAPGYCSR